MAGQNDDDQFEDDIFEDRENGEDETSDVIRNALKAQGVDTDDEDDAGFDQAPFEEDDADDRVSQEEGTRLATDAQLKEENGEADKDSAKPKSKDGDEEEDDDEAGAKDDKGKAGEEEGKDGKEADAEDEKGGKEDAPDLTAAPLDQLMRDVPEASRAELTRRLSDAERVLAPFQSDYAKAEMQRHGSTPEQMSGRLVQLAQYAQEKPAEYLAWAAREMAASPDKIGDVLQEAAKLHGFKVVKAEEDSDGDDIFDDEETKALKRENAQLRAQIEGKAEPSFGPDTPDQTRQRTVQAELNNFITERNTDGSLKRPNFQAMQGRISELAQEHARTAGQAVTVADLDRFYQQAETEFRGMFGNPAAQLEPGVTEEDKRKAAAAERAKRASTSIDGTGQGATRRPALAADADLDDVLRYALNKSVDG